MTLLLTADWHLSANPRDSYRFVFLEKTLPKMIVEERVELLLFLGDITEEKDQHPAELVNRIVAGFWRLADLCPIVIVPGNHDWFSGPANPFFGFLGGRSGRGISWVKAPTPLAQVENVPESISRTLRALLLPHSPNPNRDWKDLDFGAYPWVFAHQSFAGALSESGFQLSGVSMSWFPKGTRVISGDIHRPQEHGQLIYVGSPYSVDFGDEIEPRVLLLDGKRLESLPVPGPQKRLMTLSGKNPLAALKLTHPFEGVLPGISKGDIVKVRVEVESYDKWPAVLDTLQIWADAEGVTLHQAQPILKSPFAAGVRLEESPAKSDEALLEEYAQKQRLDEGLLRTGWRLL